MAGSGRVFVSYSHVDAEQVLPVIERLRSEGADVWFDEQLTPGVDWNEELARTIEQCAVCLYFVSRASVRSPVCEREISLAVRKNRHILPIYLEDTELSPKLELGIGNLQAIRAAPGDPERLFQRIWPLLDNPTATSPPAAAPAHFAVPGAGTARPSPLVRFALVASAALLLAAVSYFALQRATRLPGIDSRIAVLAFENFSGDVDNDYLGHGLAEELLDALANTRSLEVVPRTASFYFKGKDVPFETIARALNADVILEGSLLQRDGDRLRIATQLVDTRTSSHLWSDVRELEISDVAELKRSIAARVATTLVGSSEAAQTEPETRDGEAYDLYLQGKEYLRSEATVAQREIARQLFGRAYELDAGFAPALAGQCKAELDIYVYTRNADDFNRAVSTCTRAAALRSSSPEVDLALAELNRHSGNCDVAAQIYERAIAEAPKLEPAYYGLARCHEALGNWAAAERVLKTSIEMEPRNWQTYFGYSGYLYRRGRYTESADASRRILELTPDNGPVWANLGTALFAGNEWEAAEAAWRKGLALDPSPFSHVNIATSLYYRHEFEAARDELLRGIEAFPDNYRLWGKLGATYRNLPNHEAQSNAAYQKAVQLARQAVAVNRNDAIVLGYLSTCHASLGEHEAAVRTITRALKLAPGDPELHYYRAVVYQLNNEPEVVAESLRTAVELGYSARLLEHDPLLSGA